ncbi:MAG TPA: hypothetical protein VIP08_02325, partial [Phenylobacterium sp.]|uniref:hypothetical protein n=1 Tax=Phenylobacterium sp. TaxID=1871053 RepID=UPI002F92F4E1
APASATQDPRAAPRRRPPHEIPIAGNATPYPTTTNDPANILTAWTALEVLSPADFNRPEDLAGNRTAVAPLDEALPWTLGEKSQPKKRLFYQVVLGALEWPKALEAVTGVFADARTERPRTKAYAPLAVLTLDKEGRPIEEETATVASVAWGLPVALAGGLHALSDWEHKEQDLNRRLAEQVRVTGKDGKAKPLDRRALDAAFNWLADELALPDDLLRRPWFAIRKYVHIAEKRPPDAVILNSFALPDLIAARRLTKAGQLPPLLRRYLALDPPSSRRDLLNDRNALSAAVAPSRYSPARWPGAGRHPLVLLQQAAVNLARQEGQDPAAAGLLAVNGPPGTGKTTLLRDLIAGLVTDRAKAMMAFESPMDAFTATPHSYKSSSAEVRLHQLDQSLRGFEMLVASSNNGAVENVSKEIPALAAIAEDASALRYFKTIADNVFQRETWGLAAAPLGNSGNRYAFQQAFWDDPDRACDLPHGCGRLSSAPRRRRQSVALLSDREGAPAPRCPRGPAAMGGHPKLRCGEVLAQRLEDRPSLLEPSVDVVDGQHERITTHIAGGPVDVLPEAPLEVVGGGGVGEPLIQDKVRVEPFPARVEGIPDPVEQRQALGQFPEGLLHRRELVGGVGMVAMTMFGRQTDAIDNDHNDVLFGFD